MASKASYELAPATAPHDRFTWALPGAAETAPGAAGAALMAMPKGALRPVLAPAMVAAGVGEPVARELGLGELDHASRLRFATHRSPAGSKAVSSKSFALLVTGERVTAAWVNR